ncbi:MAG TPA: type II toxin-antitoxin system HicB family antitoxin [Geminicoccaceae bacterium]|nr:type II toxin-antitoxin system HicB family antitoxin [Geminicoccaceae bacterium]
MTTAEYTYRVIFEPQEGGGYTAYCPTLPGVVTEGESLEEARAKVIEAIEGYLEILQEDGRPIPPSDQVGEAESKVIKEEVVITLPAA